MMMVKYLGGENESPLALIKGNTYKCLGKERYRYRVVDETGEDYLYPVEEFEVIKVFNDK